MITELYECTGQVEASFASKMLASIEDDMPIWDSKVLDRIGIKPSNKRGQQKLVETIELYDVIVKWYRDLKADKVGYEEYITSFDSRFQKVPSKIQAKIKNEIKLTDDIELVLKKDIPNLSRTIKPYETNGEKYIMVRSEDGYRYAEQLSTIDAQQVQ